MKLDHTLTEAFKRFDLIAGVGSEETNEACAMTMLSWICGEEWSDHPPCAHGLIADIVVRANDADETTPKMRRDLVRAGRVGALDTWWVPTEVVVAALAGEDQTPFPTAMRVLKGIAAWKKSKERPYLRGANLGGANLADTYLRGANFRGTYLRGTNLGGANLRAADLEGANLEVAYLRGANLRGANLRGTYLADANLGGADLEVAYLRGANLRGANLRSTYLRGANLGGADLGGAALADANLGGADLGGANLGGANLGGAYGTPAGGMPKGWILQNGLWIKA